MKLNVKAFAVAFGITFEVISKYNLTCTIVNQKKSFMFEYIESKMKE